MGILQLLQDDPLGYVMIVGIVIVSVVLHELGHGLSATAQGDPTPRMLGHLTWNPVVHMRGIGLILALVVGVAFGATPVNPRRFKDGRRGEVWVSFAGPLVNLILAVLASGALVLVVRFVAESGGTEAVETSRSVEFWELAGRFNVALFLFNLLPVPPFDGFTVLFKTVRLERLEYALRRAGAIPMVVAFLLVVPGPFWQVVDHIHRALTHVFLLPFSL